MCISSFHLHYANLERKKLLQRRKEIILNIAWYSSHDSDKVMHMIVEIEQTCTSAVVDIHLGKNHNILYLILHTYIVSLLVCSQPSSKGNEKTEAQ